MPPSSCWKMYAPQNIQQFLYVLPRVFFGRDRQHPVAQSMAFHSFLFCSKVGGGNTAPAKPPQAAARPPNASLKLRFGGRGKPLQGLVVNPIHAKQLGFLCGGVPQPACSRRSGGDGPRGGANSECG